MAASSSELTDGIWPGYVAAMASLLLSLVLVLAVLAVTISQIGTITEGYNEAIRKSGFGSKEQVDRLAKVAGIGDGTGDGTGTGTGTGNAKASAGMPSAQKGAPSLITAKPDRFILDMGRANFDRDAARRAGHRQRRAPHPSAHPQPHECVGDRPTQRGRGPGHCQPHVWIDLVATPLGPVFPG